MLLFKPAPSELIYISYPAPEFSSIFSCLKQNVLLKSIKWRACNTQVSDSSSGGGVVADRIDTFKFLLFQSFLCVISSFDFCHRFCDKALRIFKGKGWGFQASGQVLRNAKKSLVKCKKKHKRGKKRAIKRVKTSKRYVTGKGGWSHLLRSVT